MPTSPVVRKSLWQRQIPTIIGLVILVVALVGGLLVFSKGTGVFAPRATPQTTPKNIKLSNVSDTSFTVSFLTDESTAGFVKYGTEEGSLKSQASDDRDQLSGSVGDFTLHHITVRGLQPGTKYFYSLGTGSAASFDNGGSPFNVSTAKRGGTPAAAKTIYGTVLNDSGGPAEGSIVYVNIAGVGEMSSLVKGSGSWAIPLSNARTADGSAYATLTDESELAIQVQGPAATQTAQVTTTIAQAQPVAAISFGQTGPVAAGETVPETETTASDDGTDDLAGADVDLATADDGTGGLDDLLADAESDTSTAAAENTPSPSPSPTSTTTASSELTVDLQKTGHQTVSTTQPTITGKAAPSLKVTITVNSDNHITEEVTTDSQGNFSLDLAQLSQQLEPGEHSVEYSYLDPATNQTVTKVHTFTVAANSKTATQIALANTGVGGTSSTNSAVPFGSGNPVPIGGVSTSSGAATSSATSAARIAQPSTTSGIPRSGVVQTTYALIFGGIFFIIAGLWSYWISQQLDPNKITAE